MGGMSNNSSASGGEAVGKSKSTEAMLLGFSRSHFEYSSSPRLKSDSAPASSVDLAQVAKHSRKAGDGVAFRSTYELNACQYVTGAGSGDMTAAWTRLSPNLFRCSKMRSTCITPRRASTCSTSAWLFCGNNPMQSPGCSGSANPLTSSTTERMPADAS
jgi:hypothetical protein